MHTRTKAFNPTWRLYTSSRTCLKGVLETQGSDGRTPDRLLIYIYTYDRYQYLSLYVYGYTYLYLYLCISISMARSRRSRSKSASKCTPKCTYMYTCTYYVCLSVCMYACMYVTLLALHYNDNKTHQEHAGKLQHWPRKPSPEAAGLRSQDTRKCLREI